MNEIFSRREASPSFSGRRFETPWWTSFELWIMLSIATTIPFWFVDVPPLTDLPNHTARFFLLLNPHHSPFLSKYYSVNWHLIGNLGVDIIARLIGPFLGVEPATRIVVATIPGLTVLGIYSVSRVLNAQVAPGALIALPLVYNWPFISGFVNFSLSAAMALLVLALWIKLRARTFLIRLLIFAPLSFMTWTAHIAGWGLLGLGVFGFELTRAVKLHGINTRSTFSACFATFPFAIMILFTLFWRNATSSPLGIYYGSDVLSKKLISLVTIFREEYRNWDLFTSASFVILTIANYILCGKRLVVSAILIMLLYVTAFAFCPDGLFAGAFVDRRILPYAAMFVPLSLGISHQALSSKPRKQLLSFFAISAIVLLAARLGVTTVVWHNSSRAVQQHLVLLDRIPLQSRVFALMVEPCEKVWARGRLDHLQQFAVIRRESVANGLFQEKGMNEVESKLQKLDDFDVNMFPTVHSDICPVPYIPETLQSAIVRFPRNQFDYVWLVSTAQLPAFDTTNLKLIASNGNDRLYQVENSGLPEPP